MSVAFEWYCLPYQCFVNTAHVEMILVVELRVLSLTTTNVVSNLFGSCVEVVTRVLEIRNFHPPCFFLVRNLPLGTLG